MTESHPAAHRPRDRGAYRSLLYLVARAVAFPHGYTLLIWATTMITVDQQGLPNTAAIFAMLIGASSAYITLGRVGVAGFSRISTRQSQAHSADTAGGEATAPRMVKQPYLVATANFGTLFLATGVCALVARIPVTLLAWLAVGATGTGVYLAGIAVQNQLMERLLRARGRRKHHSP